MTRRRVAAAVVAGTVAGLAPAAAIDGGNLEWLAAAAARLPPRATADRVALVLVDPDTEAHPAFAAHPRAHWSAPLARVVDALLDAGAAVVAVDLVLPRDDRLDGAWLRALRRAGRDGRMLLAVAPGTPAPTPSPAQVAAAGGSAVLASANLYPGRGGIVRTIAARDGPVDALAARAAARLGAAPTGRVALAPPAPGALPAWSGAALLDCADDPALRASLAGRAVFVGAWLPHEDRHASALRRTPATLRTVTVGGCGHTARVTLTDPAPGVLLHALAARTWLRGGMRWPGPAVTAAAAAGFAAAGALLVAAGRPVALLAVLSAYSAYAVLGFRADVVVPWSAGLVAAGAAAATYGALRWYEAAWRFAIALPGRYRAAPDAAEVRPVTACFADIESFTATSEALGDPERLARELGACLQHLAASAERAGGFVDKYLGDGLLVLFGLDRPEDGPRDAVAAVRAWLAACNGPAPLRIGGRPLRLRIGLATGAAHVGALGRTARVHFTAVGDCINVAARLEQLNRQAGTRVLADAATARRVPDAGWRDYGWFELRGRRERVRVFALNVRYRPL